MAQSAANKDHILPPFISCKHEVKAFKSFKQVDKNTKRYKETVMHFANFTLLDLWL